jgi:hypothetical protein
MRLLPWESKTELKKRLEIKPPPEISGFRFTLKGSPRHYDDVKAIIEGDGTATVYFGEALAYERGAGVALWRVKARDFGWLPKLYDWWAEMERIEPIRFTFHLYLPEDLKYPALDLREHPPEDVATFIREHAPWEGKRPVPGRTRMPRGQPDLESH